MNVVIFDEGGEEVKGKIFFFWEKSLAFDFNDY